MISWTGKSIRTGQGEWLQALYFMESVADRTEDIYIFMYYINFQHNNLREHLTIMKHWAEKLATTGRQFLSSMFYYCKFQKSPYWQWTDMATKHLA